MNERKQMNDMDTEKTDDGQKDVRETAKSEIDHKGEYGKKGHGDGGGQVRR